MTSEKHLKARIRARMAKTGERYATARRHVVGSGDPTTDAAAPDRGYLLRGGVHPESANIANLLHRHGADISEAMVLGIGGGLGAGYILWEFAEHNHKDLVLGFRNRWNYLDWTEKALRRLDAPFRTRRTGGTKKAEASLVAALEEGQPAIIVPDRQLIGYWHLPSYLECHGGHQLVAYALAGGGVRLDDRNEQPLTVDSDTLSRARARVPSYQNFQVDIGGPPRADLRTAVIAGINDCVQYLGGSSTSFAVPAWRKWARLLTDERAAKGWPHVFADGRGQLDALMSVWEGVEPVGASGGHLRDLYADFLDEAAALLGAPALTGCAEAFRHAGTCWHDVAETALPGDVPEYARLRELTAALAVGVAAGDSGAADRADAAGELWHLRQEFAANPPVPVDLQALAGKVGAAYEAELEAVDTLRKAAADL